MTALETYPPTLAPRPTARQLERFVDDFCLESCEGRALLWMYLDHEGVPLAPPIAVSGLPVEPGHDRAQLVAARIVEVADWVQASSVLLVWQSEDESMSTSFDDQRWAQAILARIEPGDLVVHPPVRRTPSDVVCIPLVG